MEKEFIEDLSFIKKSKSRKIILKYLSTGVKMPSEIAQENHVQISHVSRCLKELKEKHLVECINENVKKGKLYRLTTKGNSLINSDSL